MDERESPETDFDRLLDRLLRGERVDVGPASGMPGGLSPEQLDSLAAAARHLGVDLAPAVGSARPAPQDLPPFETVGEFRLLHRIGAGSLGTVYLAEQESVGRRVAVKLLRPGFLASPEAKSRIAREAQALARLRHPNIVTVHTSGEEHGVHWLAMEFVEGRGLDELVRDAAAGGAPLPLVFVLRLGRDLAAALGAAHAAGIIHRDVKPSNVRVTPEGRAVLLDFGLALDRPDSTLTASGEFRGTPRYASPEQIEARSGEIDARTDIYSLGATLYEAVTLRPAFDASTREGLFARILAGDVVPPRRVMPGLPRELETVLLTAIERDRRRRYADAAAFGRDLQALLDLRDVAAKPPSRWRRLHKWGRRHRAAAIAVLVVLGGLFAGASVLAAKQLADFRAYRQAVRTAHEAEAAGSFEDALSAWDRALGLRPTDGEALAARARTALDGQRARAREIVLEGRGQLDRAREVGADAEREALLLERLRHEMTGRTLDRAEARIVARGEGRARTLRFEAETALHAASIRAADARALDPRSTEPDSLLADVYLERWRAADARGDLAAARAFRDLVRELDHEGTRLRKIDAKGTVAFAVDPPDASIHLFRYEEQCDVVAEGDRRFVPVPVGGGTSPIVPGTLCLRVAEPASGLRPEDLVVAMDGRPIDGRLVVESAKPPVGSGDVLLSVDGREVDSVIDVAQLFRSPLTTEAKRRLVFERDGRPFEVEAASLSELGAYFGRATRLASKHAFTARVVRDGELSELPVPKGLPFRATTAPAVLLPAARLATSKQGPHELLPGSYLAIVTHPGFETERLPFLVARFAAQELAVRLRPVGSTPVGYRHIPAGPAIVGRRFAAAAGALVEATVDVPGFSIMEREVTIAELLPFLNDPAVDEALRRPPDGMLETRTRGNSFWALIRKDDEGRWVAASSIVDLPAGGVSFHQAEAFARWSTEEARKAGRATVFALPTDIEWEKAARGADGRPFPYGRMFHAQWQKSGRSTFISAIDRPMNYPMDESPFGVYDLMGSLLEWCDRATATQGPATSRTLRGVSWSLPGERTLFQEWEFPPDSAMAESGFRLVIRDVSTSPTPPAPK